MQIKTNLTAQLFVRDGILQPVTYAIFLSSFLGFMFFFCIFHKVGEGYVLIRELFCLCISPGYDTRPTKSYMHTNR